MRFRKRPKIVEAERVRDIVAGNAWPTWLKRAIHNGKIHIQNGMVMTVIGRQIKTCRDEDWISYDVEQDMVYRVSGPTMETDYEVVGAEVPSSYRAP
ncbi:MAG TPA: hypothetical protein VNH83_22710 [Bryobacteraceae bacterium]|nr:hypothetical protein [Bryobacteraceae bacterium]